MQAKKAVIPVNQFDAWSLSPQGQTMQIAIHKSSHPTLLVNFMRLQSLVKPATRDHAIKDQMAARSQDLVATAGAIIVVIAPSRQHSVCLPDSKHIRVDAEMGR